MRKPFDGMYAVTQEFGENPQSYQRFGLSGHNGRDYALPLGAPVVCVDSGIVSKARFDAAGYGNYVLIDHGNGVSTLYAHLSRIDVRVNQLVEEGTVIGLSGSTGNSTGPHLHFEVRAAGQEKNGFGGAVDPRLYLLQTSKEPNPQPLTQRTGTSPSQGRGESTLRRPSFGVGETLAVGEDELNMRGGPGVNHLRVGRLMPGTQAEVIEQRGDWVQVKVVCWLHRDYLIGKP